VKASLKNSTFEFDHKQNHKQQKPGVGASEASGFPFPARERVWLRAGLQH
jgi:hypothetical protein